MYKIQDRYLLFGEGRSFFHESKSCPVLHQYKTASSPPHRMEICSSWESYEDFQEI